MVSLRGVFVVNVFLLRGFADIASLSGFVDANVASWREIVDVVISLRGYVDVTVALRSGFVDVNIALLRGFVDGD